MIRFAILAVFASSGTCGTILFSTGPPGSPLSLSVTSCCGGGTTTVAAPFQINGSEQMVQTVQFWGFLTNPAAGMTVALYPSQALFESRTPATSEFIPATDFIIGIPNSLGISQIDINLPVWIPVSLGSYLLELDPGGPSVTNFAAGGAMDWAFASRGGQFPQVNAFFGCTPSPCANVIDGTLAFELIGTPEPSSGVLTGGGIALLGLFGVYRAALRRWI
jgi:hypothetical protein